MVRAEAEGVRNLGDVERLDGVGDVDIGRHGGDHRQPPRCIRWRHLLRGDRNTGGLLFLMWVSISYRSNFTDHRDRTVEVFSDSTVDGGYRWSASANVFTLIFDSSKVECGPDYNGSMRGPTSVIAKWISILLKSGRIC